MRKARTKRRDADHWALTTVPRGSVKDSPFKPELDTTLHFYVNFVLTNTGQSYAAVRFYSNAAFSPDIVTPANKPNGFTALSGLYGSYKVIGYSYNLQIFTREAFGFIAMVRNTNTDPGTSSGQLAYVGEALSSTAMVPAAGAPPVTISGDHNIAAVTGRPIEQDDILGADVTAVPSDATFLGIYIQAATETFTASTGANCSLHMRLRVRFFNRKLLNDSFRQPVDPPHSNSLPHPYIIDTGIEAKREAARRMLVASSSA